MRRVVRAYWRRMVGPWLLMAIAFLGVPFGIACLRGDRSWLVGAFGTGLAVVVLLAASIYRAHLRHAMNRVKRLNGGAVTLHISDDGVRFVSATSQAQLAWREIVELWQYRDFWVLLVDRNQPLTLPLRNLDEWARRALEMHLRAAGARLRDRR
ncbi:MAG: YcxB family protein [Tahibacter sp.]